MRRKTNDMEITTIEGSSVITCPNLRMGNGHLHSQVTSFKASEHTNTQTDKKNCQQPDVTEEEETGVWGLTN